MQMALLKGQGHFLTLTFSSNDARVLCDALAVYYSRHEPSRVATVSALVARVYGGPHCLIDGIRVNHALWTARELCEQLQAMYGERVPVTFNADGSLDVAASSAEHSASAAPREAQETQLDPDWIAARQASLEIAAREASLETQMDADWIAAREASLVEARRRAERGPSYQKELEQALALSRA